MKKLTATGKPQKVGKKPEPLLPIDGLTRIPVAHAPRYTGVSLVTVYAMVRDGRLESYVESGRRFLTIRSVLHLRLPPAERPKIKPQKFERIKITPIRDAKKRAEVAARRAAEKATQAAA